MGTETRELTQSEAISWIYTHNLGLIFPNYVNGNFTHFTSKVPISGLTLPNGWYYNEKNGITNKHISSTGIYSCIDVVYQG